MKTTILRVLVLAGVGLGLAAGAGATPVILQFDAVITDIQGDLSRLDIPFTLEAGESIAGELFFASEDYLRSILLVGPNVETGQGVVRFDIDGAKIESSINTGGVNSGVVDINNPPTGPTSSITLGWSGGYPAGDAFPLLPGRIGSVRWVADIVLIGEDGTIDSPDGVLDFDNWNALNETRRLTMLFGFPTDTVTVQAELGNFTVVPEPSSGLLASAFALLAIMNRRRSRRSKTGS